MFKNILAALVLTCLAIAAESAAGILNGDFESGVSGWDAKDDNGMSKVSAEAAKNGKSGLRVTDDSDRSGSSFASSRFQVRPEQECRLVFHSRIVSGGGIGIYFRFYDGESKQLNPGLDLISVSSTVWKEHVLEVSSPKGSVTGEIWIHSYNKDKVVADFDDFRVEVVDASKITALWPAQYKIKPNETSRLTEADVVGPDGIVYPNWTHVGVRGGIPNIVVKARLAVSSGSEISETLEKEAAKLGQAGGAILIPPGTFYLDKPVSFFGSHLVIRGSGRDKTKLVFRYGIPRGKIYFPRLKSGDAIGLLSIVEINAAPEDLKALYIDLDGKNVAKSLWQPHWGLTFSARAGGAALLAAGGPGLHTVKARAEYANGEKFEETIELNLVNEKIGEERPYLPSAIAFVGTYRHPDDAKFLLTQTAKRGEKKLQVAPGHGYQVGDCIRLEAPPSARWNDLVKNAGPKATYRENLYEIKSINGNEIGISEPLRLEFPAEDESYVQKVRPVENCGVEDLTLEQTQNIWTSGVVFSTGWNCWLKGVSIVKAGRHPFVFPICKYGEIRDSEFHDAWWKGGGGTAYVGFERSYDCLMDGVKTTELRHAPNLNWAPSGCVFRNSIFEGSDGQWHSGWANEILMENLVIHSATNGGGYGFGLFTTTPEDNAHGPIGPRSVVYHCDITSPKDGLILNGMNEGWVIAYNRFRVGKGRAISARLYSFDHIVKANVFALENVDVPAIRLANSTCYGWEIEDNLFYGVKAGEAIGGPVKPLLDKNNQVFPFAEGVLPTPKVPSIFEWQKQNVKEK